jgi:hypothetical protein
MQVLVDAECTHDGSIKHIQKFEFWGWKTLDRRVLDAGRTENLLQLQVPLSFRQYLYFRSSYVLSPFQILSIFLAFLVSRKAKEVSVLLLVTFMLYILDR